MASPWEEWFLSEAFYGYITQAVIFRKCLTVTLAIETKNLCIFWSGKQTHFSKNKIIQKHRNEFWKNVNEMVNGGLKNKTKSRTQAVYKNS